MSSNLFASVDINLRPQGDGNYILSNNIALPEYDECVTERLSRWAAQTPDNIYLSELPEGAESEDQRQYYSYAQIDKLVSKAANLYLQRGIGKDNPPTIIAGNSVAHAVAMLGAMRAGTAAAIIPPSAIAPAAEPFEKLGQMMAGLNSGLILTDDINQAAHAFSKIGQSNVTIEKLSLPDVDVALENGTFPTVSADSVGKFLFTSGSTGSPKTVPQTQRMMISNMQALGELWPFLKNTPPVMVDWLPWSHVFGGNCCFNMALYYGGTMHIDRGNPSPAFVHRTINAIENNNPNVYFNVPIGYAALADILKSRPELAKHFYSELQFLFNAGAALPAPQRAQLEELAAQYADGAVPIIGAWGSTETAPFSTAIYFENTHAGNLGLPMPGTDIKMLPDGDGYELRVRGPNVMPGYWHDEKATKDAFDDEGFFQIGDRAKFVDEENPKAGIYFDGRLAENFKLLSGTWVNVGALRLAVITAGKPIIRDVVLAGEGRNALAALIFLNTPACHEFLREKGVAIDDQYDLSSCEHIAAEILGYIEAYNAENRASSRKIAHHRIQSEDPSLAKNEITEKGYINQRAVLKRRADEVALAYGENG